MSRRGITLLEMLVVIAIGSVIFALLLSAVQSARETARRLQCSVHVKSLILAHNNYHEVHNQFPNEWTKGLNIDKNWSPSSFSPTPAQLQCPSNINVIDSTGIGLTPYGQNVFLIGKTLRTITDGSSNTVLHGEFTAQEGTAWIGSPGLTSVNCRSSHTGGAQYGMADGSVRFLNESLDENLKVNLLLPDDGNLLTSPL